MSLGKVKYIAIDEFIHVVSDYPVWSTTVKIKTVQQYFGKILTNVSSRVVDNRYYFDGEMIVQ